jgi:Zn finger protein HypA/HybF involved in hydrogenase expression
MDTQKPKTMQCQVCGKDMQTDQLGRQYCPRCNKNTPPKDLYEEALFDLKDYQK